MKICSWCGKQSEDDAAYCPKCGNTLMGPNLATNQAARKKDRTPMYVGVTIVAFLAVAAIVGVAVTNSFVNNWNSDPAMTKVSMSVQGVAWANATEHPAPSGQRYLIVTATLQSSRSTNLMLTPAQFVLSSAEGGIYFFSNEISSTVPGQAAPGATVTIMMAFLIPESATPSMLTFFIVEDMGMHVHAPI
jgi:hypothetical protein